MYIFCPFDCFLYVKFGLVFIVVCCFVVMAFFHVYTLSCFICFCVCKYVYIFLVFNCIQNFLCMCSLSMSFCAAVGRARDSAAIDVRDVYKTTL